MVIFQTPGGSPGYNQFETLDEAVSFVEQLRNDQDVSNARIFALEEVKFDFRPYFRVELQALNAGAPAARAPEPVQPAPEPAAAPAPMAAPAPAPMGPGPAPGAAPGAFSSPAPAPQAPVAAPVAEPPAPAVAPPAEPAPVRRGLFGR
jgi:hypothetical protein